MKLRLPQILGAVALSATGCASDDDALSLDQDGPAVVERYADQVHVAYDAAVGGARDLQVAVGAFVAMPTADTHAAAKQAWVAARGPYGRTEAFRFYDGPIDDAQDGPEGRINAWPMDEVYIDYVEGAPDAGIVNDVNVTIDAATLIGFNELGGETNIATGWHAIEFLLWGQDLSDDAPGERTYEDFLDTGPVPNGARRRQYLTVVTDLLVEDLESVAVQWMPNQGYAKSFTAMPASDALSKIMRGLGALAGAELSGERINVAYDTKEQEDEHSCFSDNTHNDLLDNFMGISHVYFADFAGKGPSIDAMVESRDPALAQRVRDRFAGLQADLQALPHPFDQAIQGDDQSPGRVAIAKIVKELRELSDELVEVATVFGIAVDVEI